MIPANFQFALPVVVSQFEPIAFREDLRPGRGIRKIVELRNKISGVFWIRAVGSQHKSRSILAILQHYRQAVTGGKLRFAVYALWPTGWFGVW